MFRSTNFIYSSLAIILATWLVPWQAQSSDSLQIKLAQATQLAITEHRGDARNLLEEITVEYPDSPEAYNNLAVLAAYSEDWNGAISLLKQALATDTNLQTSYRNLNLIYRYRAALAYRAALPQINGGTLGLPDLAMLTTPLDHPLAAAEQETEIEPSADSEPAIEQIIDEKAARAEIITALQQWASAWSAQDIDAYLSSYVPDYVPDGSDDHASWRELRRQRLLAPSFIEVAVFDETIDVLSAQRAMVVFTQKYRSITYRDRVRKLMLMQRSDNGWIISREHTLQ